MVSMIPFRSLQGDGRHIAGTTLDKWIEPVVPPGMTQPHYSHYCDNLLKIPKQCLNLGDETGQQGHSKKSN